MNLRLLPFIYISVIILFSCNDEKGILDIDNNISNIDQAAVYNLPNDDYDAIAGDFDFSEGCSTIPSLEDVQNQELVVFENFISAEKAADLNIPVLNVGASKNLTVYVKDYKWFKACSAGEDIEEHFGYFFRSVIEISNYEATVEASLPALAANGTLKNKKQSFYFYKKGFDNPEIEQLMGNVSGKVFNVENYALFQDVTTQILQLLRDSTTTFQIGKIGEVNKSEDIYYESPVRAYTIEQIVKGKSCQETKNKVGSNNHSLAVVEETYNFITENCNTEKPTEIQRLTAKKYLGVLK